MMMNAAQDDFPINPDTEGNWDAFEQRENWQLVPPIVTGGQIPALQTHNHPRSFQTEAASLFHVNFMGADQNWYSISAHVQRPASKAITQPALYVAGHQENASTHVQSRRQAAPQTLAHPTWHGTETAQTRQPQPPLAFPPQPPLHPAWNQNFAADSMKSIRYDEGSSEHQVDIAHTPKSTPSDSQIEQSFVLQFIQPGLVGLMDGSVSTLAPIFAVAFATHQPFTAFIVGMASALGAGISMAFAEGLSDDGDLTGRGSPLIRGGVTGLMTFLSGVGHALPFLVPNLHLALTLAYIVVAIELLAIAGVRYKYFKTKLWLSLVQVVGGGLLVFLVALLLGNA